MLGKARRIVSALGMIASVWALSATNATAEPEVAPLTTGQDCSKGCIDCQRECHESRCMNACTFQWSGCCMTAGLKPPAAGSCACSTN